MKTIDIEDITGRRQAEQALNESEQNFRALAENSFDAIMIFLPDGTIAYANSRAAEMTGYGTDELLHISAKDLARSDKLNGVMERYRRRFNGGASRQRLEGALVRKDGESLPVEIVATATIWKGKPASMVTFRDITERKQLQEKLINTAEEWRTSFDSITDLISVVDRDFKITRVNMAFANALKMKPQEVIGKTCYQVVHGTENPLPICPHKQTLETKKPAMVEYIESRLGIYLEVSTSPIFDGEGEVIGSVHIAKDITERKQIESMLRFTDAAFNSIHESVIATDTEYIITHWNEISEQIYGIKASEALGKNFFDVIEIVETRPGEFAKRTKKLETEGYFQGESLHRTKCAEIWVNQTVQAIEDNGKRYGWVALATDITKRKRAEEALQEKNEQLDAQNEEFQALNEELTTQQQELMDKTRELEQTNVHLQKAEHYLAERVKELNCLYGIAKIDEEQDITLDELYQEVVNLLPASWQYPEITCARVIINGNKFESENCRDTKWKQSSDIKVHREKTGVVEIGYLKKRPEIDEGPFSKEERALIDAVAEQLGGITERKQAEEQLRESEEFRSSLLSNSPSSINVINPDMSIRYVNPALEKLTGFSSAELIGKKAPYPWWPEGKRGEMARDLEKAMHRTVGSVEHFFQRKNGERFWVEITSTPVMHNGEPKYYLSNWIDITERKRAEEARLELDRMKADFISNISHELRTPLHSIKGFTELMLDGKVPDPETQTEFLTIIDEQSEHLGTLIDNLLDVSRLESGRFRIQKRYMSIKTIIRDVVKGFYSIANVKSIVINEDIPRALPKMEVDEERLGQVMVNLLGNAIKFSNDGSSITVKAEVRDSELLVQVADHGVGIPEEDVPHVFERFYQVKDSKITSGTGLGLYISKQIIEAHGGRIWAESKLWEGSTFSFSLPLNSTGGNFHG